MKALSDIPVRRKLGYLIPQFPGQTHIFFWREIEALEGLGVDVTVFSTRKPVRGLIAHNWSQEAIRRTTYLALPRLADVLLSWAALAAILPWKDLRAGGVSLLKDLILSAPAARRLRRECRRGGIGHVHVHSCGRAALIAALARRMGGPTYSLTLHGPLSDYGSGQGFKWRHASFATVITRKLLDELQVALGPDLPDRIVIRPMGVDTEVLQRPEPYQPATPGGPIRVFSCGRLNVVKGHQDLMQAVRQLVEAGLDIRLEIAGEDDDGGSGYHAELDQRIRALDLADRVRLLGAVDADQVKNKLLSAHVFALASWHEPLGVAYMEAMSCGVPTIGTDAGGVGELIEDGLNGLLVPPKQPDELASAIRRVVEDPVLANALSVAGRDRVVQTFRSTLGAETLRDEIARLAP